MTAWHGVAAVAAMMVLVNVFAAANPPRLPTAAEIRALLIPSWPEFIAGRYGANLDAAARDFDVSGATVEGWLAGEPPSADAVALALVLHWGLEAAMVERWKALGAQGNP